MLEFDCVECGAENNPAENTHCYNCRQPRPIVCPHCRANNSHQNTHCYNCRNAMYQTTNVTYVNPVVPVPVIVHENNFYGHNHYHNHHDDVLIDLDGDGDIDIIID